MAKRLCSTDWVQNKLCFRLRLISLQPSNTVTCPIPYIYIPFPTDSLLGPSPRREVNRRNSVRVSVSLWTSSMTHRSDTFSLQTTLSSIRTHRWIGNFPRRITAPFTLRWPTAGTIFVSPSRLALTLANFRIACRRANRAPHTFYPAQRGAKRWTGNLLMAFNSL